MKSKPKPQVKKVVLAYSGGLDTSVIVPWLKENYGCEVVCFCADVGQGDEDLQGLEQKALKSGANQFILHDMKEEFASEYLFPMLKMGAVYEHKYLLGTSVARPLIAKHLVDVAHEVGADAIAHGATGKGNDQVRFELTVMALDPRLKIIAPWREWEIRSREDAIAYRRKAQCPGDRHDQVHLQPRLKSVASFARRRFARRSMERTRRSDVPDFHLARKRARAG